MVEQARALLPDGSRIIIEPGRSMVATSACTVYRVTTIKRGVVTHVAVDGGMGDNLEVSLTGQRSRRRWSIGSAAEVRRSPWSGGTANPATSSSTASRCASPRWATCSRCRSPAPTATMSNQYNGARRVPVVFAREGNARLVVRRDTWDDLLSRDV